MFAGSGLTFSDRRFSFTSTSSSSPADPAARGSGSRRERIPRWPTGIFPGIKKARARGSRADRGGRLPGLPDGAVSGQGSNPGPGCQETPAPGPDTRIGQAGGRRTPGARGRRRAVTWSPGLRWERRSPAGNPTGSARKNATSGPVGGRFSIEGSTVRSPRGPAGSPGGRRCLPGRRCSPGDQDPVSVVAGAHPPGPGCLRGSAGHSPAGSLITRWKTTREARDDPQEVQRVSRSARRRRPEIRARDGDSRGIGGEFRGRSPHAGASRARFPQFTHDRTDCQGNE